MDEQKDRRYGDGEPPVMARWEEGNASVVFDARNARIFDQFSGSEGPESPSQTERLATRDLRQGTQLDGDHVRGVYDVGAREREERRRSRDASRKRRRDSRSGSSAEPSGRSRGAVKRRGRRKILLAGLVLLGAASFVSGFIAMWAAGTAIVGGSPFGGGAGRGWSAEAALAMRGDYEIEPEADLLAFRDLSYVPVKAFHWLPYNLERDLDALIEVADRTEINAIVITVKDEWGQITYETDLPMAKRYGTAMSRPYISDVRQVLARLYGHNIVPIARIVCFQDNTLARTHPELAILDSETGSVFVDTDAKLSWLNPYNHDVWEYLVAIAEEAASLGFREIQFDYIRFPSRGIQYAVYPGRYCAKEDAIAGFLAYARPRLETLGVWTTADVFGMTVKEPGDAGIGQQLEKVCQQVDIVSSMAYPAAFWAGQYGFQHPPAEPYELTTRAMTDLERRLVGTGAKGRPYLQAYDYRGVGPNIEYTADMIVAQIQAAERLGFTEWLLWGGYNEAALRLESTGDYADPSVVGSESTTG